jgi:hypothetical protein|tara:strand:+ start:107 stop:262 length:156 start_codon:yes stop_codon:yes gene_type:complete
MTQTFDCDCGNVCTLKDNEEQSEHFGDGTRTGMIAKCKCCGKKFESPGSSI